MEKLQWGFLTNKITKRWLLILSILERERTCSSQDLSKKTELSSRTIIKEIKDIRGYFGETIELTTNNAGYTFNERIHRSYQELKRALVEEDPLFIIIQGILMGELRFSEEWAFYFHLSESTMKRYLVSIIPFLENYQLKLSLSPVDLVGKEGDIRKFLKDFYYEVDIVPRMVIPFQLLKDTIPETPASSQFSGILNVSPSDFRYFLYIMIQRFKNNRKMENLNVSIKYTIQEINFLREIKNNIKKRFKQELSDDELLVLYIYSTSQRKLTNVESAKEYCSRFGEGFQERELAKSFLSGYDESLFQSQPNLYYFIEAFFISVRLLNCIGSTLNNSLSVTIDFAQKLYPDDYNWVLSFLKKKKNEFSFPLLFLEDIAANLVLTMEAVRDINISNPKNIAFLFEGSHFIIQSVNAKAYRYFKGHHQLHFLTIEDLDPTYLKEYAVDIFVTNQEDYISEMIQEIDFVLFKSIPDQSDWNRLLRKINPQIVKDFILGKTALSE